MTNSKFTEFYDRQVILADVNIPFKLCLHRNKNNLFFCINADEFSDQSFHLVVLNLDTGVSSIVTGIRDGFASAVDQTTGEVYLGGSDGIFKYNYSSNAVDMPALVKGTDIFDMHFQDNLYFVETANQHLYIYKNHVKKLISDVNSLIHHFIIDVNGDLYFVNSAGLFLQLKGSKLPVLIGDSDLNIRGATTDCRGTPFFVAQNGIYYIKKESKELVKAITIENGHGLAFDRDNNIIYSSERSVFKLCHKY